MEARKNAQPTNEWRNIATSCLDERRENRGILPGEAKLRKDHFLEGVRSDIGLRKGRSFPLECGGLRRFGTFFSRLNKQKESPKAAETAALQRNSSPKSTEGLS